jgi:hypothetical protein
MMLHSMSLLPILMNMCPLMLFQIPRVFLKSHMMYLRRIVFLWYLLLYQVFLKREYVLSKSCVPTVPSQSFPSVLVESVQDRINRRPIPPKTRQYMRKRAPITSVPLVPSSHVPEDPGIASRVEVCSQSPSQVSGKTPPIAHPTNMKSKQLATKPNRRDQPQATGPPTRKEKGKKPMIDTDKDRNPIKNL